MPLSLPPRHLLDADRVAQVLRDLGFAGVPDWEGFVAQVAAGCPQVAEIPGEPVPTWSLGGVRVRHRAHRAGDPVDAKSLICSCAGSGCPHVGSTLVVLAYNDPERRAVLEAPSWEVALAPLAPVPAQAITPHDGHVRYVIHPPSPGRAGLEVVPQVVRRARADGRALVPARAPASLAQLERTLHTLTDADRAFHPAWRALDRARRLERAGRREATRHLSRTLLGPLSQAEDVRLQGEPVRVRTAQVSPRLVASRTPTGGLALRFEPALRLHWADVGIVLTQAGEVRPLADDVPEVLAERLLDPLPHIPAGEVSRFVDRLVVGRGLEVDLPADVVVLHPPDARVARLTLEEIGDRTLRVRLDLVYRRHGSEAAVGPSAPGQVVKIPDAGAVERDRDWERQAAARFAADLGGEGQVELDFLEALAFLRDRLPRLAERWPVYGRDRLVRLHVRGTLVPRIRFRDGEDWFELDVGFALGGRRVRAAAVLRSWLEGKRHHRLDDGSLARLPQRWLARHGARVDQLVEVRRAQRRLGSWHAWMASDLLGEAGPGAARWLGWVRRAEHLDGLEPRGGPAGLTAILRPYQAQGLAWLRFLHDHGLHGILADEMGLGKTVQALAAVLDTGGPALVVAPTSVICGWRDQAAAFAPGLRCLLWHGARDPADLDRADLVVTTYALLRRDIELLAARRWRWAILDEGQAIKNPASQAARCARRLQAHTRLVLSGTPLENELTELWSLFAFLMPGYLGRRVDFHARYTRASRHGDRVGLDDLTRRIRPFLLRRRKTEVAPELPPLTQTVVRVPLSDRERSLYDSVRLTVKAALDDPDLGDRRRRSHLVLEGLTRLRQACCHPGLLPFPEARRVTRSSKLEALLQLLGEARSGGRRSLVFSQWVQLLDRVASALEGAEVAFLRLQGDTRDRARVVDRFQAPDGPSVFLISIKAGGTGLNLTAADTVFHLDPWWNPQVEDQATDRAHRIGQARPVSVYRLVAADTIEERVLKLQRHKRALFEGTVERAALDLSRLTGADLEALFAP